MKHFINRTGLFLVVVGIAVLALFFTSDFVQEPSIEFLFWGVVIILFGMALMRISRPAREESRRFRLVRKLFSRKKKEEEQKDTSH
ncbi:MAG: hypothetical protein PVF83_06310 [Anaerolineales bacterium]|jgi:uncharacterized membrane protein YbhN (UPF0104 family)